jgi:hypothetical protein
MARETVAVRGLSELIRDFKTFDKPVRTELRKSLRDVGDIVKRDAAGRFGPVNSRSAGGFKTRVRQRGIAVEQSIRKTTGKHPEYGSLQMRKALLPALMSNEDDMHRELERAMDKICRQFERRGP